MKNQDSSIKVRGRFPSGVAINAPAAFLLGCFVASSVPARASPDCKTYAEARAAFPTTHLYYRIVGGVRCWGNTGPRVRSTLRARDPRPAVRMDTATPAAPRFSVLWPVLAGVQPPETAALYHPGTMTRWPILLDIDSPLGAVVDANGNDAQKDFCCWPALESDFSERWFAMPASWFPLKGGT